MTMEETMTLKLYSPLTAELAVEGMDYYDEADMILLYGSDLVNYRESILEAIENERLPEEDVRGLMTYFSGSESLNRKVKSWEPTVEVLYGRLYGVALCEVTEPLTRAELEELKEECTGQYSDGWGEGFEQRPIRTGDGELSVHFWQDRGFYILTRQELERRRQMQIHHQQSQNGR